MISVERREARMNFQLQSFVVPFVVVVLVREGAIDQEVVGETRGSEQFRLPELPLESSEMLGAMRKVKLVSGC